MAKTLDDVTKQLIEQEKSLDNVEAYTKSMSNDLSQFLGYIKQRDRKADANDAEALAETRRAQRNSGAGASAGGLFGSMAAGANRSMDEMDKRGGWKSWIPGATMAAGAYGIGKSLFGSNKGPSKGFVGGFGKNLVKRGVPGLLGGYFADDIANFLFGKEGESGIRDSIEESLNLDKAIQFGFLGSILGKRYAALGVVLGGIATDERMEKLSNISENFNKNIWPEIETGWNKMANWFDQNFATKLPTFKEASDKLKDTFGKINNSIDSAIAGMEKITDGDPNTGITGSEARDMGFWGLVTAKMSGLGVVLRKMGSKGKAVDAALTAIATVLGVDLVAEATGLKDYLGVDELPPGTFGLGMYGAYKGVQYSRSIGGAIANRMTGRGPGGSNSRGPSTNVKNQRTGFSKWKDANKQLVEKMKKGGKNAAWLFKQGYTISKDGFILKNGKMISGAAAAALLADSAPSGIIAKLAQMGSKKIAVRIVVGGIAGITAFFAAPAVAVATTVAGTAWVVYDLFTLLRWLAGEGQEIPLELRSEKEVLDKALNAAGPNLINDITNPMSGFNIAKTTAETAFAAAQGMGNVYTDPKRHAPKDMEFPFSGTGGYQGYFARATGSLSGWRPTTSSPSIYSPANDMYSEKDRGGNMAYQDNSTTVNQKSDTAIIGSNNLDVVDPTMMGWWIQGREMLGSN